MERLVLTAYDDARDRSPLICGGGAVLVGAMAWREFSRSGEVGLRLCGMLLVAGIFAAAAVVLVRRRRVRIEVVDNSGGEGRLTILRRGTAEQVVPESRFGYVKLEEGRATIHYYEGDDLRRLSVSIRGADKKGVEVMMEVLGRWQS